MSDVVWALVSFVATLCCGFFAALWWGERARRIDAQYREAGKPLPLPRPTAEKAATRRPDLSVLPDAGSLELLRAELMEDCMSKGFDEEACEEDVERMLSQMGHDRPGVRP